MKILYAPMERQAHEMISANVICGYDMFVLDTLLQCEFVEQVFYFPHKKSIAEISCVRKAMKDDRISTIKSLNKAKDSDVLITDLANIAFAYSLFYKKPSIYFLPGFTGVTFEGHQDRLLKLMNDFAFFCHSLQALRDMLVEIPTLWARKEPMLQQFLDRALI
ncbi:MAG: hypothetical protein K2O85_07405 [Helicobacter sp.]|mgnify:CR=1 FL=1|nr:hypothetical protein [Helicobacter sp.]